MAGQEVKIQLGDKLFTVLHHRRRMAVLRAGTAVHTAATRSALSRTSTPGPTAVESVSLRSSQRR